MVKMYLRRFDFVATSSKQEQRILRQIWLHCSHFLMKTATSNSSNSSIAIINNNNNILCLLFLSKLSFKRETIVKIGRATALKLLLYESIFSPCSMFLYFLFNKAQIKTIYDRRGDRKPINKKTLFLKLWGFFWDDPDLGCLKIYIILRKGRKKFFSPI